ncbi:MAG: phosphatase PAP2 family protein [Myxococcota bacterium]
MTILLVAPLNAASTELVDDEQRRPFLSCRRDFQGFDEMMKSESSINLYHGLAYLGGTAGIRFGADANRRWSRRNGFDTGIRGGLRLNSTSDREDVDLISDLTLAFSVAVLPTLTIGAKFARTHDCVESWDMFADAVESIGLTLFATELVKLVAGRDRPYTQGCGPSAPRDADCGTEDSHRGFFSGHASLAAAGAGLTCSFAVKRDAWGTSSTARAAPCALGVAAALTTGLLRISADRHWGSDVLVGFGIGALVGYFDIWGPLDLLKFTTRNSKGQVSSKGLVVPHAQDGRFGARLVMQF